VNGEHLLEVEIEGPLGDNATTITSYLDARLSLDDDAKMRRLFDPVARASDLGVLALVTFPFRNPSWY